MGMPELLLINENYEVWGCNWCKFRKYKDGTIEMIWLG